MFKRKIYLVEWKDILGGYNSDIIKAKNPANAWKKIRSQNPILAVSVLKISLYDEVK